MRIIILPDTAMDQRRLSSCPLDSFVGLKFSDHHNLSADNRVSLLIDNRSDLDNPLYEAAAVTAYGTAEELDGESRQQALANFLSKHPQMKTFTAAPTTALFQVNVEEYHLVQRFQNVTEFVIKK